MKLAFSTLLVFLFCYVGSAGATCDPIELKLISTPAPPTNVFSLGSFTKTTIPEKIDLAIVGDSIANQLYVAGLGNQLNAVATLQLAGGGDGIQNALFRLQAFHSRLKKSVPAKALIVLGTNNIGLSACAIESGFEAYLDALKKTWPTTRLYVLPILPRGANFRPDAELATYNSFLRNNSSRLNFTYVDLDSSALTCGISDSPNTDLFLQRFSSQQLQNGMCGLARLDDISAASKMIGPGAFADCNISATLKCDLYKPDFTHLSDKGLDLLMSWIVRQIGSF